jgi:hypothetical protein
LRLPMPSAPCFAPMAVVPWDARAL